MQLQSPTLASCEARPLLLIPICACSKQRMDRIKQLRWRQRSLPEDVQTNLSPQEIQVTHPSTLLPSLSSMSVCIKA